MNTNSLLRPFILLASLLITLSSGTATAVTNPYHVDSVESCTPINFTCEAPSDLMVDRVGASTVMLIFNGNSQCSGTLINNALSDGRPYILTSRHCNGRADADEVARAHRTAATIEIIYRYETDCATGEEVGRTSTRGAIHRALVTDLWLLEANDPPPPEARAYFAGWDLRQLFGPGVTTHHGGTRPKEVLHTQIEASSFMAIISGQAAIVWDARMVDGRAMAGASGSGLFNVHNRLVGAAMTVQQCAENNGRITFAQLAEAWGYDRDGFDIAAWLDPADEGVLALDGISPEEVALGGQAAKLYGEPDLPRIAGGGPVPLGLSLLLLVGVLLRRDGR